MEQHMTVPQFLYEHGYIGDNDDVLKACNRCVQTERHVIDVTYIQSGNVLTVDGGRYAYPVTALATTVNRLDQMYWSKDDE